MANFTEEEEFEFALAAEKEATTRKEEAPAAPEEYAAPKEKPGFFETVGRVLPVAGRLLRSVAPVRTTEEQPVGEAALSAITGTAASAAGGLAGIAGGGTPEERAERVRSIEEGLTGLIGEPRTTIGKVATRAAGAPFELASAGLSRVGGAVGQAVAGPEGRAAGETIGEILPQVAGTVIPGGRLAKRAVRPVEKIPPQTPKEIQAKRSQDLGYVLPPSEANPSLLNRIITGWGGKTQTEQAASIRNQPVTNRLAKRALGIAEDKTLSTDLLENVRANAGKAYQAIKQSNEPIWSNKKFEKSIDDLSQDWNAAERDYPELAKSKSEINDLKAMMKKPYVSPTGAIEMVKDLRASAKDNLRAFTEPSKVALGRAQRSAADALDNLIEDNLKASGKTDLVSEYKKSRELIAKSYDVEAALNETTGNVNAVYLGKLLKKRPLTGELKDIARFARTFEKSARTPEAVGTYPGISPLDIAVAGMEAVPALVAGRPGVAAGVLGAAAGRPLARTYGLSERYQRRGGGRATRTEAAERAKQALRGAAVPAAVGAGEAMEEERKSGPYLMDEGM